MKTQKGAFGTMKYFLKTLRCSKHNPKAKVITISDNCPDCKKEKQSNDV